MWTALRQRWKSFYRKSSIQGILSVSFTAVAALGMILMGLALFLRFSSSTNVRQMENSQADSGAGQPESGHLSAPG